MKKIYKVTLTSDERTELTKLGKVGDCQWGADGAGWDCSYMTAYYGTQVGLYRYARDFISRPNDASDWRMGSWHPGTCNFVAGDGSVHGLSVTTPDSVLLRLVDNNNYDGQPVSIP